MRQNPMDTIPYNELFKVKIRYCKIDSTNMFMVLEHATAGKRRRHIFLALDPKCFVRLKFIDSVQVVLK